MKEKIVIIVFLFMPVSGISQKLYGVINLTAPFSGTTYAKTYNREEFRPRNIRINGSWGIDFVYKAKKMNHKLSVQQVPFGEAFKLINKFMNPPYRQDSFLLGFSNATHEDAIDHFIFSYGFQKEGKKEKGFLFRSRIRFNYSAGMGISFNRSKAYYNQVFSRSSGGSQNPWTYYAYEIEIHRIGPGLFLNGGAGFDFINKKGKRKLSFNIFYKQGLTNMARFDIHYQYGYWNDPAKRVDVPNQKIYSRGTTFGFSLGVPIRIIK
ncbi:MAG: hypothetical protein ACT4OJ_09265 [Bacteroidota bacterium]